MVVIASSGTGDVEGISEIGISHSVVPTLCGPNGLGTAGIGLSCASIVVVIPSNVLDQERSKWSRGWFVNSGRL